jgi:diguanylate cyclase (GGDEF)-like protein
MGQLQSENYSLRQQLEALLHEARCNEDKMRRFDQLERRLIGAPSLLELVRLLLSEYKAAFGVEWVTLALVDPEYEAARILEGEAGLSGLTLLQSGEALESLYRDNIRPLLGAYDPAIHRGLFDSEKIASVALLPLVRQDELIGSLHFGSADPERYCSDCGTQFLERLTAIISVCLGSALNQERLKLIGLTDALTGVQNRRYFEHRSEIEARNARRHNQPLACMFLDVDRFKRINDTYGHQAGDEVLRHVAGIILSQLRAGDTVARYGGEEFVVMLPQTAVSHARNIAERIRERIADHPFGVGSGQVLNVTISIGLSMLEEGEAESSRMIESADRALYRAKSGGRNRVVCECIETRPADGDYLRRCIESAADFWGMFKQTFTSKRFKMR